MHWDSWYFTGLTVGSVWIRRMKVESDYISSLYQQFAHKKQTRSEQVLIV